jgi:hypothetical protein
VTREQGSHSGFASSEKDELEAILGERPKLIADLDWLVTVFGGYPDDDFREQRRRRLKWWKRLDRALHEVTLTLGSDDRSVTCFASDASESQQRLLERLLDNLLVAGRQAQPLVERELGAADRWRQRVGRPTSHLSEHLATIVTNILEEHGITCSRGRRGKLAKTLRVVLHAAGQPVPADMRELLDKVLREREERRRRAVAYWRGKNSLK